MTALLRISLRNCGKQWTTDNFQCVCAVRTAAKHPMGHALPMPVSGCVTSISE